jgi:hypothetical protein
LTPLFVAIGVEMVKNDACLPLSVAFWSNKNIHARRNKRVEQMTRMAERPACFVPGHVAFYASTIRSALNSYRTMHRDEDDGVPQIDTGAFVTYTDRKDMLHGYQEITPEKPCPLPTAIDSDCVPKGYEYVHVPAYLLCRNKPKTTLSN